jgi:hypothetical protein
MAGSTFQTGDASSALAYRFIFMANCPAYLMFFLKSAAAKGAWKRQITLFYSKV